MAEALKVAIVGAGFGGLGMGVALKDAGINDFAILEKGADVGGVWRENTYPGCSCDVPSHLYSFSFAPYRSRDKRYPPQREILAYLRQIAHDYGVLSHIHFNTAITAAAYLENAGRWELISASGRRVVADVVVFAVGQLHRPRFPDILGKEDFPGVAFHSAEWDHGVNLRGRNISVIGTGSSAAQMLPEIASIARNVTIYQRTPHWVLPKPAADFGIIHRWGLRVPGAHMLYRQALYYGADILLAPIMRRRWPAKAAELVARMHLRRHIADPTLRAQLTPSYPIGSKRIIFDSHYYSALSRENVQLVTDPILRITGSGIETVKGEHRNADIIIYATGFRASEFLVPMTVRGRNGRHLNEQWLAGAEAFLGLAVHGYPNAFIIAGPNTFNPAGSNPTMKECQITYIVDCLLWSDKIGATAIEVSAEAARKYQQWMQNAISETIWPTSVASWYKHESGRVINPWPTSARTFARLLRSHPKESFVSIKANA